MNAILVDLTYITSRGRWYHASWKGDEAKSGGVATNIGVHFFDMLGFVFGPLREQTSRICATRRGPPERCRSKGRATSAGSCRSTRRICRPPCRDRRRPIARSRVDGDEVEFSEGFADLHTRSYE